MPREKIVHKPQRKARCLDCDASWEGRNALGLATLHTDYHGHTTIAECIQTIEFSRPGPKLRFRAVHEERTWWIKDYRDPKNPVVCGGPFSRTHAQRIAKRFNEENTS